MAPDMSDQSPSPFGLELAEATSKWFPGLSWCCESLCLLVSASNVHFKLSNLKGFVLAKATRVVLLLLVNSPYVKVQITLEGSFVLAFRAGKLSRLSVCVLYFLRGIC
jgi:hypothetical protein